MGGARCLWCGRWRGPPSCSQEALGPVLASAKDSWQAGARSRRDRSVQMSERNASQSPSPPETPDVTVLIPEFTRRPVLPPAARPPAPTRPEEFARDEFTVFQTVNVVCFHVSLERKPIFRYPVLSSCDSYSLILPPH